MSKDSEFHWIGVYGKNYEPVRVTNDCIHFFTIYITLVGGHNV